MPLYCLYVFKVVYKQDEVSDEGRSLFCQREGCYYYLPNTMN